MVWFGFESALVHYTTTGLIIEYSPFSISNYVLSAERWKTRVGWIAFRALIANPVWYTIFKTVHKTWLGLLIVVIRHSVFLRLISSSYLNIQTKSFHFIYKMFFNHPGIEIQLPDRWIFPEHGRCKSLSQSCHKYVQLSWLTWYCHYSYFVIQ